MTVVNKSLSDSWERKETKISIDAKAPLSGRLRNTSRQNGMAKNQELWPREPVKKKELLKN